MKRIRNNEPIAKFYTGYLPGNEEFGYNVFVFSMKNEYVKVESEGKLQEFYVSFEEFFDDLCQKNPLWFTYHTIQIPDKFEMLVSTKLSLSYELVFKWVFSSILRAQTWTSKTSDRSCFQNVDSFLKPDWIMAQIGKGLKSSGIPADCLRIY